MAASYQLEPHEQTSVLAYYDQVAAEPKLPNQKPFGCVIFLFAGVIFFGFPYLSRILHLAAHTEIAAGRALSIALLIVTILGLRYYFFGDKAFAKAYQRSGTALDWYAKNRQQPDLELRRKYAVDLLCFATSSGSPSINTTYDHDKARAALGPSLPYVVAVERWLKQERKIWPVFTLEEDMEAEKRK